MRPVYVLRTMWLGAIVGPCTIAAPAFADADGGVPDAAPTSGYQTTIVAPPEPHTASASTRTRPILEAVPRLTADELLSVAPGLVVTHHGGQGKSSQMFFRGFDAVHGQDLEITAGGIPVNDVSNIHGQGYADLHFLPPEIVQAIAVTPGPFDPRQGDFAVAGSVRIELGWDAPGLLAKASAGSFGTRRAFLGYGGGSGTFAAAELVETNGWGPARAAERAAAVAQAVLPLGDGRMRLRLFASAHAGRFDSAGVLRLSDVTTGAVPWNATYDPRQSGSSSRVQGAVELTGMTDAGTSYTLLTWIGRRDLVLRQNFTGFLRDPNGDLERQDHDALEVGTRGELRRRVHLLHPADRLELGVFARSHGIEQSQRQLGLDGTVTQTSVDARVLAHDVAGWGAATLHPFTRLTLRGGVRVDTLAYRVDDALGAGASRSSHGFVTSPRLTADVRLHDRVRTIAAYGEGFRSPQARSLSDGEPTPFTRVRAVELGTRWDGPAAAASVAAFRTWLDDDLVFDHITTRNERVPATLRTGLALDVNAAPRPWLVGALGLSYTHAVFRGSDAERRAGDLVPYAPQLVGRGDVAFLPSLGTIGRHLLTGRLGVGGQLFARRPLPYGEWGHDAFVLDASAGLRAGAVELRLDVWNVLDARWFDGEYVYPSRWDRTAGAALVPQRHVTTGAPRTALVTLVLHL